MTTVYEFVDPVQGKSRGKLDVKTEILPQDVLTELRHQSHKAVSRVMVCQFFNGAIKIFKYSLQCKNVK